MTPYEKELCVEIGAAHRLLQLLAPESLAWCSVARRRQRLLGHLGNVNPHVRRLVCLSRDPTSVICNADMH